MTLETTAGACAVTWTTSAADPCVVLWRRNRRGARWQVYGTCDTPQEAQDLAVSMSRAQFIPQQDNIK